MEFISTLVTTTIIVAESGVHLDFSELGRTPSIGTGMLEVEGTFRSTGELLRGVRCGSQIQGTREGAWMPRPELHG